jgi:hypothetical protein
MAKQVTHSEKVTSVDFGVWSKKIKISELKNGGIK